MLIGLERLGAQVSTQCTYVCGISPELQMLRGSLAYWSQRTPFSFTAVMAFPLWFEEFPIYATGMGGIITDSNVLVQGQDPLFSKFQLPSFSLDHLESYSVLF